MKLAVAQMSPQKGLIESNLDKIIAMANQAAEEGASLVLFPEAAVTGYFLEGGVGELAMSGNQLADRLTKRLKGDIELVVGFYEFAQGRPYNSAAHLLVKDGLAKLGQVYRKLFPPTYGVFDEGRFHSQGDQLGIFETSLGKVGVLICEDMWHSLPRTLLALHGCQIILVPAATPARGFAEALPSNINRYERMLVSCCEENGVYCALSCLTGSEGNRMMAGGSMVVDPFGRKIAQAPGMGDALLVTPIELNDVERAQRQTPLLQDMRNRWPVMKSLAENI